MPFLKSIRARIEFLFLAFKYCAFRQRFLNQFGFGYEHVQYDEKPDPLTPPALFDFDQPVAISKAG